MACEYSKLISESKRKDNSKRTYDKEVGNIQNMFINWNDMMIYGNKFVTHQLRCHSCALSRDGIPDTKREEILR